MSFIKSRKHATPSLRPLSPSMACLATSIALALPAVAMAADTPATGARDAAPHSGRPDPARLGDPAASRGVRPRGLRWAR